MLLQVESAVAVLEWLSENPSLGWILVLLYAYYELHWGQLQSKMTSRLEVMQTRLDSIALVVRLMARTHDDINTAAVDEAILSNGQGSFSDLLEEDVELTVSAGENGGTERRADGD